MSDKSMPSMSEIEHLPDTLFRGGSSTMPLSPRLNGPIPISYSQYLKLKERSSPEMQKMLTAKLFLDLCPSTSRNVDVNRLVSHLKLMKNCATLYFEMLKYDKMKCGIITEDDFFKYVSSVVSNLPFMDLFTDDNPDFVSCFSHFIVQRMLTGLDPLRTKVVQIDRIIRDPTFMYFVQLDQWEDEQQRELDPVTAKRLVSGFHALDTDKDQKITRDDLLYLSIGWFSELFIDRLVLVLPGNGEMDMSWFFRFCVIYANLGRPWANAIMFDVLDLDGNGIINEYEYHLFFHALMKEWRDACEAREPSYDVLAGEAFDMCNATSNSMTKEHFIKASRAGTFTRNLVDLRYLVRYLHRKDIGTRSR